MFPSNRDILCEAFLVEAIKFAIWDFFPPNRHKSAKNKASKQPFPACSWPMMWFKDLYSIPVCYYLFLSTNISLKCSGPGPFKAFSFFKKGLLLSEEIAKFLHSFTLSQQWNRTWPLTEPSLEAWPHLQPNYSSFSSSFLFFPFFFSISQHPNSKMSHQPGYTSSRVRGRLIFVVPFKLGTQRCFVDIF